MSEKLYLMPGKSIGKKGLPKNKLEVKKDGKPLLIEDKYMKIISKNIPVFKSMGVLKSADELAAIDEAEKKADADKKEADKANKENLSKKMKTLLEQAEEVGLEDFDPEKISQKELKTLIQEKIKENQAAEAEKAEELKNLKAEAEELEIEVPENATAEEIQELIKKELDK